MRSSIFLSIFLFCAKITFAQIGNFISVKPDTQTTNFVFPIASHEFQRLIEHQDIISNGTMADNFDFTSYVPINASSKNGYVTINHELSPGGLTAMDVRFDSIKQLWVKSRVNAVSFASLNGTARNCSGGVTPWGNVITCEETTAPNDSNNDGYYDLGWHVEINPQTQTTVEKLWAMGNGPKENIVIHPNRRTAYFGNDANPGYLYKFVSEKVDTLSNGKLYVYSGLKAGNGNWLEVPNSTKTERNTTMTLCASLGATIFNGIEDVEIGPDGKIYFAVKNENVVYRFTDSDAISGKTVSDMMTYVGNASYNIDYGNGMELVPWGGGNDNLAFDYDGNLWVLQDGGKNYIWVVLNGHSQANPKVKLFGIAPRGSEPTGINFTPDYKYMFLSFQHPNSTNNITTQLDASKASVGFEKDIAIVIALKENLGCELQGTSCNDNNDNTANDQYDASCNCRGIRLMAIDTINSNLSENDAEENLSTGSVNITSTDLEFVFDGTVKQIVGLRFPNLPLASYSHLDSAFIQFTSDEPKLGNCTLIIKAEKTLNSLPFVAGGINTKGISSRLKTNDSIFWNILLWPIDGTNGQDQRSPNIVSLIDEVISQPGWLDGNKALTFLFTSDSSGIRIAKSNNNGNPSLSPKLILYYSNSNLDNVGIGTDTPSTKLEVKGGDVFINNQNSGLLMKSPDGKCWKIEVANDGSLKTKLVDCPN